MMHLNRSGCSRVSPGGPPLLVQLVFAMVALAGSLSAAPYMPASFLPVTEVAAPGSFQIAGAGSPVPIHHSADDAVVVGVAAEALRGDVERVTGQIPVVSTAQPSSSKAILIGTLGQSDLIDGLVAAGKLDVSAIQGQWEAYIAAVVESPLAGMDRALVIAGSDRRGTAFGVFGLSEAMGVSPWYWWGDVPVVQKASLHVGGGVFHAPSPAVKYRGIFINDEDWGLEPWARQTFDPVGDVGPTTYAKVFELLLRLHANYIWPAMHPSTRPFYTVAGNREIADDYAIVMGTSHHEPMLRNTLEYSESTLGPYNYWTNRQGVADFWEQRVVETAGQENIYTVGMRGLSDGSIAAPAGTTTTQKRDMIQNVIIPDQRQMLSEHVNANPTQVAQVYVPYKEALLQYQAGLQLPDDVTLVWPDDNHGYIRQLSNSAERARSGGSGVYYHLSYWGAPANYLWLLTTPPGIVRSEMLKAWDYGARRIWIANVGDIKPGEIGMEFFLRLARNPEAFRDFDQHAWFAEWAGRTFGPTHADAIAGLMEEYHRLNIAVRPEHLSRTSSGFDFTGNGDEAQRRLDAFAALQAAADGLYAALPAEQQAAFYEMVLYPIRGSHLHNRKILLAERSRLWASQGRAATNALAAAAQAARSALQGETTFYNQSNAGGKWKGMITSTTTGAASAPFLMPATGTYGAPAVAGLGVAVEGSASPVPEGTAGVLPAFNPVADAEYFIDVFNTGSAALAWTAQASHPWISLSQSNGEGDARIMVGVDWEKVPRGHAIPGTITIQGAGSSRTVKVASFYPLSLNPATLPAAVENNGSLVIEAEDFTSFSDRADGAGWRRVDGAAASGDGMSVQPLTIPSIDPSEVLANSPSLTWRFHAFERGSTRIRMECLPTHRITSEHPGCRYAISLNGDIPRIVDIDADENSGAWSVNVLRAAAHGLSYHVISTAGIQTLQVWMIDPGVVLDRIHVTLQPGGFEAEAMVASHTAGRVYRSFAEAEASGGEAVALESVNVGDQMTLELPAVATGSFDLKLRVKQSTNRGRIQLSLADSAAGPFVNIGPELDLYSATAGYADLSPIRVAFAAPGNKFLRFTVTGRNSANTSGQSWITADRIGLVATNSPPPSLIESENVSRTGTAGRTLRVFSDAAASAGAAVALESTTVGDQVTFSLPGVAAGAHDLTVRVKKHSNRGMVQLAVADAAEGPFTNFGGIVDLYGASEHFADLPTMRFTAASAGTKFLRFTVTGRNAAATSSWIAVDRFNLQPVDAGLSLQPVQDWRWKYFGTFESQDDAADDADPDHDGLCNLLEYACGDHPTMTNAAPWHGFLAEDRLGITFPRRRDAVDVIYRVRASGDLATETEIWSSANVPYPGGESGSVMTTVFDSESTLDHRARFLRLEVLRP